MSLLRRRRRESVEELFGLSESELDTLAKYNSEVNRGIVHTDQWRAAMAQLQIRYDQARQNRLQRDNNVMVVHATHRTDR